jgi:hypothetical protein
MNGMALFNPRKRDCCEGGGRLVVVLRLFADPSFDHSLLVTPLLGAITPLMRLAVGLQGPGDKPQSLVLAETWFKSGRMLCDMLFSDLLKLVDRGRDCGSAEE